MEKGKPMESGGNIAYYHPHKLANPQYPWRGGII
jgi:hypothetical protein